MTLSVRQQEPRGLNDLLCLFIWSYVGVLANESLKDLRKALR